MEVQEAFEILSDPVSKGVIDDGVWLNILFTRTKCYGKQQESKVFVILYPLSFWEFLLSHRCKIWQYKEQAQKVKKLDDMDRKRKVSLLRYDWYRSPHQHSAQDSFCIATRLRTDRKKETVWDPRKRSRSQFVLTSRFGSATGA